MKGFEIPNEIENQNAQSALIDSFIDWKNKTPEDLVSALNTSPAEEFNLFLQRFGDFSEKSQLPDNVVEALVWKICETYTGDPFLYTHALWPEQGSRGKGATIFDRAYRLLFTEKFHTNFKRELEELDNSLGQQPGHTPEELVKTAEEVFSDKTVPPHLKSGLLSSLQYHVSFAVDAYLPVFEKKLDFQNQDNFGKTADFLRFLIQFYNLSGNWSFSEHLTDEIEKILEKAVEEKKGNYFLNLQARDVLDLADEYKEVFLRNDETPFLINGKTYAWHESGALYVSDEKDHEKIEELSGELKKVMKQLSVPQEVVTQAHQAGERLASWTPPQYLFEEKNKIEHEVGSLMKPVDETFFKASGFSKGNQQNLRDYAYMLSPSIRDILHNDLGINIEALSPSEQFYALDYFKTTTIDEADNLKHFSTTYGRNGLRTFLSLEKEGKEFGDKILELGEKLPKEQAQAIFEKFGEFADGAENASQVLRDIFSKEKNISAEVLNAVSESLLKKGTGVLKKYADVAERGEFVESAKLSADLDSKTADTEAFLAGLKFLRKSGVEVKLGEVSKASLASEKPSEISEKEKNRMKEIYLANYSDKKYAGFIREVLNGFENELTDDRNSFQIFRFSGEIIGFYRVKKESEDAPLYFGAFNVDTEKTGSGIGEAMMRESLDHVAEEHVIEAFCVPEVKISENYLERGFAGFAVENSEGVDLLHIFENKKMNSLFASKAESPESFKEKAKANESGEKVLYVYTPANMSPSVVISKQLASGEYVLTRFLSDQGGRYFAFEKITPEIRSEYQKLSPASAHSSE